MTEHSTEYRAEPTDPKPTDIAEYRTTTAALELLREKYATPFDATTTTGLAAAKAARTEIRGYRSALEKTRADLKAPLLAQGQWIDAEAKRIAAELLAIENPIDATIKAEEKRKAEEKAARERAEAARVAALQAQIDAIRRRVLDVANRDAATIRSALADAQAFEPDPDVFAERWPNAMNAVAEVRLALDTLLAEREEREAREAEEEAGLRARQQALARQQAELDRRREAEEAQRRAEREELARWRAEETARQQAEAKARAEEEARQQAKPAAKTSRARQSAKADPLAEIKNALAAGTITGPEAIDRAYRLGFEAGDQARKAA